MPLARLRSFTFCLAAVTALTAPVSAAGSQERRAPQATAPASSLALATFDSAWTLLRASYARRGRETAMWDSLRTSLRPRAAHARSDAELRVVIGELLTRVDESHFSLVSREAAEALASSDGPAPTEPGDPGIEVRLLADTLVVWRVRAGSPAARAGVRPGWTVDSVGRLASRELLVSIAGLSDQRAARAARVQALVRARQALEGNRDDSVRLALRDATGTRASRVLAREASPGRTVGFGNLPPMRLEFTHERRAIEGTRCLGVIRFNLWLPPIATMLDRAMSELRGCEGIVIDLRGNTGGIAAMSTGVAGWFIPEERLLGTLRTAQGELRLTSYPRRASDRGEPVTPFAGRLAVLLDELSVSTTEVFARALQSAGRVRVFGERSAGQAQPAMLTRLPNGDRLLHVVADFVMPDGSVVEGFGVTPDVPVPLTRSALLAGRDVPLETALEWVGGATAPGR
jgi:carboxyl-terminal processing protease